MKKRRLIIIKLDRTGSTMLFKTLNNHPDLRIKNEILNDLMNKDIDEQINFINKFMNKTDNEKIHGFTINLDKYNLLSIDFLKKIITEDSYIIFLLRKNILKKIVSALVVRENIKLKTLGDNSNNKNYWGLYNTDFKKKINIDMELLTKHYNIERKCYTSYLDIYNKLKPYYDVDLLYYENIVNNTKLHIDNIFSKIGLETPKNFNYFRSDCHKLLSDDLRDVIINYDETIEKWNELNKKFTILYK